MKRMKRAIVLLLAFILSVTVIPSVQGNIVEAKTESGVVVTVQNASSAPGKEVNVDLTIGILFTKSIHSYASGIICA